MLTLVVCCLDPDREYFTYLKTSPLPVVSWKIKALSARLWARRDPDCATLAVTRGLGFCVASFEKSSQFSNLLRQQRGADRVYLLLQVFVDIRYLKKKRRNVRNALLPSKFLMIEWWQSCDSFIQGAFHLRRPAGNIAGKLGNAYLRYQNRQPV